jgi:hypothetical protein
MAELSPASQKLLREIAKYDKGAGVLFRPASCGRYSHPNTLSVYNGRTFYPLTGRGLVDDGDSDSAPVRITEAGRKLAAELDAAAAEKKSRPKPNADGPTALRLLREIAKLDEPALIHSNGGARPVWRLGARDGYSASADTWLALSGAGRIHIEYGFAGGKRVSITDAGKEKLENR